MKLSKIRHRENATSQPSRLRAQASRVSLKSGSLEIHQHAKNREANFPLASSAAAVVGEAYIVPTNQNCQRPIQSFCIIGSSPKGNQWGSPCAGRFSVKIARFRDHADNFQDCAMTARDLSRCSPPRRHDDQRSLLRLYRPAKEPRRSAIAPDTPEHERASERQGVTFLGVDVEERPYMPAGCVAVMSDGEMVQIIRYAEERPANGSSLM
jgi:hypothetical protein